MSNLRRYHENGYIYFITNVTYDREPMLTANNDLLWNAICISKSRSGFELIAWVVLPDHFHLVIDPGEVPISIVLQRIKMSFAAQYRKRHGLYRGRVWQNRFWDHVIRDQEDMNRHVDYIHFNPVKHGFVKSPVDWPDTSFHEHVRQGLYQSDWSVVDAFATCDEFGE